MRREFEIVALHQLLHKFLTKKNKLINILKIKFHSGEYRVDVCVAIAVRVWCVCMHKVFFP